MRARESQEVWERRVARWKKSGLSCEAFADREGVRPATLAWWRSELRRRAKGKSADGFVEIAPVVAAEGHDRVEVSLSNGRIVRVPTAFDDAHLLRVLALAERR